ncbi:hypothetical protein L6164_008518 [Bauhinia variegata]|uniref:Uncharacterized protein n=1 Tax=Bauhinia variegata TaxID=167791 RepID=A0ACB9PMI5_BAUVA|nr:hypothetical protein L6164_008518 [Bauhinia variegata]
MCDHCKKTGHTRDTCWEIHGKPPDWKPRKGKPRGYQTSQEQPSGGTSVDKEQLGKLIDMLSALQKTEHNLKANPTASMAHQGRVVE